MTVSKALGRMILATVGIALVIALALTPVSAATGIGISRADAAMDTKLEDIEEGKTPGVSVIKDATGKNMAYIFKHRRHPVSSKRISQPMKDAIVAIEDRRFYEHSGVDFQGNFRAMISNVLAGGVTQGASTLNQQYVKNYLLLVDAETDEERAAATEQTIGRKLREIRMAAKLDKTMSKDEILANYLNLVPWGNHAYGVEAAARTYFGTNASKLNVKQSAMLAGMVQSSEYLNPWTNTQAVVDRRNQVLNAMAAMGKITEEEAEKYSKEDLGVLKKPATLPNGCIGAGNKGFFCDYALKYLEGRGIKRDMLENGSYTIRTTLDPQVQKQAQEAVVKHTSPDAPGVAEVMNVVEPSSRERKVLAMVSSRDYGLDLKSNETILPQPYSMVGNGAGSIFKIFTAAAAINAGYGIENQLDVPNRYEAKGLGAGGAENCPPDHYCVENAASYKNSMTFTETLAHSPNTTFIKMAEEVGIPAIVDMSVKLGLRSYEDKGTHGAKDSIANFTREANLGSYTLGPTPVNPLELANVGATIASGGMWCEPSPITSVKDKYGNDVFLQKPKCERAMGKPQADALANAMKEDATKGTASAAANNHGWSTPIAAKTGTTESHNSAAFLGFNSGFSAAPYIYNDGVSTRPLCTGPVRQCEEGSLFGGKEPASTFFSLASQIPEALNGNIAPVEDRFKKGSAGGILDELRNLSEGEARKKLEEAGFKAKVQMIGGVNAPKGQVVRAMRPAGGLSKGAEVTLQISDGSGFSVPDPSPSTDGAPAPSDQGGRSANNDGDANSPSRRGNNGGSRSGGGNRGGGPKPQDLQRDAERLANDIIDSLGL